MCLPSQEVAFPVQCVSFVRAFLSHFLSADPFSSNPLLQVKRQVLPCTFPQVTFSSLPFAGASSAEHRRTEGETIQDKIGATGNELLVRRCVKR